MNKGFFFGVLTTFLWAVDAACRRYAIHEFEVKPFLFVCLSIVIGAFTLIMIGGPGNRNVDTLKEIRTWLYGACHVGNNIFYAFSMIYITGTETAFLIKMNVIIGLTVAYFFFKRVPKRSDIVGCIVLLIGLGFIVWDLPSDIRGIAFTYVFFSALFYVGRTSFVEKHKEANKAVTIRDKCRTTGLILLATSMMLISISLVLSLVKYAMGGSSQMAELSALLNMAPDISDFKHKPTFWFAVGMGFTLVPLSTYFYFQTVRLLKMETTLMITGLLPFFTFATEYVSSLFTSVQVTEVSKLDLSAGVLIVLSTVIMSIYKQSKGGEIKVKDKPRTEDDYDILKRTLRFHKGNHLKAAKALDLDMEVFDKVINGKGSVGFNLSAAAYRDLMRNYNRNIAMADALTGLPERDALQEAVEGAMTKRESFSLAFIDLDKFKPINDNYGHEAGDHVLRTVAEKVTSYLHDKHLFSRVGGDEFVVMLRHVGKEEAVEIMDEIINIICEPIQFKNVPEGIFVGASYGVVEAFTDGKTFDDLLSGADQLMYRDKSSK